MKSLDSLLGSYFILYSFSENLINTWLTSTNYYSLYLFLRSRTLPNFLLNNIAGACKQGGNRVNKAVKWTKMFPIPVTVITINLVGQIINLSITLILFFLHFYILPTGYFNSFSQIVLGSLHRFSPLLPNP